MREIKYQAFVKHSKTMIDVRQLHFLSHGIDVQAKDFGWYHQSEVILRQFTGLKDKNGKEIFEGDIVQRKCWHQDANGITRLSDDNSYMKEKVVKFELGVVFQGYAISESHEVIGNIYEAPDLLEPQPVEVES